MPKFLLVYHGGTMPESEEEGQKVLQAWMSWFETLGDAVADDGNPVGKSKTVHPGGKVTDDGGPSPASGYSILHAKDMDDAVTKAKGCPHLADGGTVEVAEIIEMG